MKRTFFVIFLFTLSLLLVSCTNKETLTFTGASIYSISFGETEPTIVVDCNHCTASISASCKKGQASTYITVSKDGESQTNDFLFFSPAGGTYTFTVDSSHSWKDCRLEATFIVVMEDGGTITVTP